MNYRMITGAALVVATALGGCTADPVYPDGRYGYGYAPGYYAPGYNAPGYYARGYYAPGYSAPGYSTAGTYEPVPGSYSYRYQPFYSPDYNSSFDTYRTTGGGNG